MPDMNETAEKKKNNQIKFFVFGLTVAPSSFTLIIRQIFPKTIDYIILVDMDDILLKAQRGELLHFH